MRRPYRTLTQKPEPLEAYVYSRIAPYLNDLRAPAIAFIGGGGKTSSILTLARELKAQGKNAIICTTTKMYANVPEDIDTSVIRETLPSKEELSKGIVFIGHHLERADKLVGHDKIALAKLHEYANVHWLLCEADGSRGRSLKAHESYEPVIPRNVDLTIAVIGADIYGKPVNDENIHRLEIFKNLFTDPPERITEVEIAEVINHKKGYFWNTPESSKKMVLLNKVRTEDGPWVERLRALLTVPMEVVEWGAQ